MKTVRRTHVTRTWSSLIKKQTNACQTASLLQLRALFVADVVSLTSLVLGQIEVQYSCYQYVKACLQCDARPDGYNYTRHAQGQEWMKVSKIHFPPRDSWRVAGFQGFRLGKAFLVTHLSSNAAATAHNRNNKKCC